MLYFAFARPDTRIKKHFRPSTLGALMPHLGQLRMSVAVAVHLANGPLYAHPIFEHFLTVKNPGIIFPRDLSPLRTALTPPPNLTSLKEKR